MAVVSNDFKIIKSLLHIFGAATEKVLTIVWNVMHNGQTTRSNERDCLNHVLSFKISQFMLSTLLQFTQLCEWSSAYVDTGGYNIAFVQ